MAVQRQRPHFTFTTVLHTHFPAGTCARQNMHGQGCTEGLCVDGLRWEAPHLPDEQKQPNHRELSANLQLPSSFRILPTSLSPSCSLSSLKTSVKVSLPQDT